MGLKTTGRNNQALAGVLEALFLIALLIIVIGIIQTQYVPQLIKQREAEHMNDISNQFSYLKAMIDIQSLAGSMETNVPLWDIPIMTQIKLGSRELPYLVSAPAYGEIILRNTGAKIDANPPISGHNGGISFTLIIYHCDNLEFPAQSYILKAGVIILNQTQGNQTPIMRAGPSIKVEKPEDEITMLFYLPNYVDAPGKNYSSGLEGCLIRTNYQGYTACTPDRINIGGYILLYTEYPEAWNESLHMLFNKVMYDPGAMPTPENRTVNITVAQYQGKPVVKIAPIKHPIILEIILVDIEVQIGKGWIYT
jgi:hypothetical protein